ncbi:transposase-like protein [Rhizobium ruizarguesonis]
MGNLVVRLMVTDKLRSYAAAQAEVMPGVEHRSHKEWNNRAENSHLPLRRRERRMMRSKAARQYQRFVSVHGQVANLFHLHRKHLTDRPEFPVITREAARLIACW